MTVIHLGREFVQIWKGRLAPDGKERWFLDWYLASGGMITMSDRATEAEIEDDARAYGLPVVRHNPNHPPAPMPPAALQQDS